MTLFRAHGSVPGLEPVATAIAAALVGCALWTVVVWTTVPLSVQVDGRWETVVAGTSVADLIGSGVARSSRGDMLKVGGGVAVPGRGGEPRITVDGRRVPPGQRLQQGDVIDSRRGPDVLEPTEIALVAVPVSREQSGAGPDAVVRQLGAAGLQRVRWGVVSREIEESSLLRPATPMIVQRQPFAPGTKVVALTFDDGPWPGQTQRVLEVLASQNVKATFFMVGGRVRLAPDIAKRAVREGHLAANHTQTHQILSRATPQQVAYQMAAGRDTLRQVTGVEPGWFRAPAGVVTRAVRVEAAALGERIAGWTVDPADWRKPGADVVTRRVVGAVRPGAIVLLHDGGGDRSQTIAALPAIIAQLKAQGYRFVTLDELLP